MTLLSLNMLYVIAGLFLLFVAACSGRDKSHRHRLGTSLFWGVLAIIYIFGKLIPPWVVGWTICGLAILAATRHLSAPRAATPRPDQRAAAAATLGNRIFLPALLIPTTAVIGTLVLARLPLGPIHLLDTKHTTLAALGLGCLLALALAVRITRAQPLTPLREGARLLHLIGWALLLPQLLAALGGIFAQAGLGTIIADLVATVLPTHLPFVAAVVYCASMALFTICLGNAFAAFPVITLGIGLPIIVQQHGGNPAIMAAIGMLSGYCGTLMTPMAANFNIVPAMLLELRDPHAVIKAQTPMGLTILAANILLLYTLVYRF
ncbi:MAG: hypothetical protein RI897_2119 [Verrucomicrobiota bacterium]